MRDLLETICLSAKNDISDFHKYRDLYDMSIKTNVPLAVEYLRKICDMLKNAIRELQLEGQTIRALLEMNRRAFLPAELHNFGSCLMYVERNRGPKKFYMPRMIIREATNLLHSKRKEGVALSHPLFSYGNPYHVFHKE